MPPQICRYTAFYGIAPNTVLFLDAEKSHCCFELYKNFWTFTCQCWLHICSTLSCNFICILWLKAKIRILNKRNFFHKIYSFNLFCFVNWRYQCYILLRAHYDFCFPAIDIGQICKYRWKKFRWTTKLFQTGSRTILIIK